MSSLFFGCGGFALLSLLPFVLTVVAIVDIIRTGADWFWIPIVLFFPVVGTLAYFVLVRSRWSGGRLAAFSPDAARRLQAQRRLRELAVQLAHWRGPAILAEAGEELLVLGKHGEAERHLREAQTAGASPEEVGFPLAQALEMQGRFAEAAPLLEPLVRAKPDQRFGLVQLHFARCLDESGRAAEAEAELRDLLKRRSFFEAQVRLARLLARRGENDEAQRILADVRASAAQLPHYLKREHKPWIRAARRGVKGDEKLPAPRVEGGIPRGRRLRLALVTGGAVIAGAAAVALVLVLPTLVPIGLVAKMQTAEQEARLALTKLDDGAAPPATASAALTEADVAAYLAVRAAADPAAAAVVRAKAAIQTGTSVASYLAPAERLSKAKVYLYRTLATELARQQISPRRFDALLVALEWRCLHRPQATVLGVPAHFRQEWQTARMMLNQEYDENEPESKTLEYAGAPSVAQTQANARAQLADLERLAAAAPPSPAEQELCARHRDRLAATDPAAVEALVCALDSGVVCY